MKVEKTIKLTSPYDIGYGTDVYFRTGHNHDFYEILIVMDGNAIHCINDGVQILKKGDVLCIRPDDIHYLTPYTTSAEKFDFFNLRISCQYMETQFSYCKKLKDKVCQSQLPYIAKLGAKEILFFEKNLRAIKLMDFCEEKSFIYYSIVKAMLSHILIDKTELNREAMPEWFENLLIQISKAEVLCMDYPEIARIANVSNSYLWKTFKKYLNMAPTEYINSLRIELAYDLIVKTNYSLSNIASKVGFNDYSYFYKKFYNRYDISPKMLRKQTK